METNAVIHELALQLYIKSITNVMEESTNTLNDKKEAAYKAADEFYKGYSLVC